jgi:hypothetical protein
VHLDPDLVVSGQAQEVVESYNQAILSPVHTILNNLPISKGQSRGSGRDNFAGTAVERAFQHFHCEDCDTVLLMQGKVSPSGA